MPPYRHTQIGHLSLVAVGLSLVLVAAVLRRGSTAPEDWAVLGIVGMIGLLFSSLTVELRDSALRIWFGPGFPRWRWPLHEIALARPVRNPWYAGWGIHWVAGYWVFNVSGWQAIEVVPRTGRKFRIGTDEPHALLTALRNAGVRVEG